MLVDHFPKGISDDAMTRNYNKKPCREIFPSMVRGSPVTPLGYPYICGQNPLVLFACKGVAEREILT